MNQYIQTIEDQMLDEQALADMEDKLAYENSLAYMADGVILAEIDAALAMEVAQ